MMIFTQKNISAVTYLITSTLSAPHMHIKGCVADETCEERAYLPRDHGNASTATGDHVGVGLPTYTLCLAACATFFDLPLLRRCLRIPCTL